MSLALAYSVPGPVVLNSNEMCHIFADDEGDYLVVQSCSSVNDGISTNSSSC